MSVDLHKALTAAVLRLLRPLVRILLRNGISYGEFTDLSKQVYIDVAERDFVLPGKKQTVSRISILTGLSRKEVARIQKLDAPSDHLAKHKHNRAARVISGWMTDERFSSEEEPRVLDFEGGQASFSELVKQYSGDMPVRSVFDEMERVGAVARDGEGRVHLKVRAYTPHGDEAGKLFILGSDAADLVTTIDHNLQNSGGELRFQRKVAYDNLPRDVIPKLRKLGDKRAQNLLESVNRFLVAHDRDMNSEAEGEGRMRAGYAIYYFEEDLSEEE
ncbi:hypothetical protein BOW53_11255 [Solemya pervernicosa gill symbiont]|uniref:Uncharacterized protein n=2 Tax=Gammaproteobacteria incertae sedis TaxID=118884 RepID=A0A1T2L332_9GAMM|nr:DUF6502 family protein [Candidatus Reidiella endopervernicosa]OOZ39482.1 hypothetical protein BOW53_11255 [Solemya pervernicosa gill symbiont]QKQ25893.1 hypothetical protein HUE57_06060 [Candidatus Reidiella endopervernicosa]